MCSLQQIFFIFKFLHNLKGNMGSHIVKYQLYLLTELNLPLFEIYNTTQDNFNFLHCHFQCNSITSFNLFIKMTFALLIVKIWEGDEGGITSNFGKFLFKSILNIFQPEDGKAVVYTKSKTKLYPFRSNTLFSTFYIHMTKIRCIMGRSTQIGKKLFDFITNQKRTIQTIPLAISPSFLQTLIGENANSNLRP